MTTQQIITLLRFQRDLEKRDHAVRRRRMRKQGQTLVTELEVQAAFATIANQIKLLEKTFKRLETLRLVEEALTNKDDKSAGRNKLRLGYGGPKE